MKKRWNMKKNKAYSLVEMIIVIAIIAVMCGAAMVTVTLINSAKTKEAGVTLDSEISGLLAKCKSQIVEFDDGTGKKVHKDFNYAIAIYKNNDNRFYIANGFYKYDKATDTKYFYVYDAENANGGKGTGISSRVSIGYVPGSKNSGVVDNVAIAGASYTAWVISFDKAGRCISGVGTYELNKASDNSTIDTISVKANGSHVFK